eukprot:758760-Hanusia_phi.AAC.7
MRWWTSLAGGVFSLGMCRTAYVAFVYRPTPDYSKEGLGYQPTKRREVDLQQEPPELLLARNLTMSLGKLVSDFLMKWMNSLHIVQDSRHDAWLARIRSRPPGIPLITVANHESCCDDPGLMGALIPWDVAIDPARMRWGICTQEICFPKGKPLVHTFIGCGQALPIRRGGGVDQPLLFDVARELAAGRWVHVFPEARVVQSCTIGLDPLTRRTADELSERGRLKWGVGKLIAHSPVTPVIIPLYHKGMAGVMPQHNRWVCRDEQECRYDNRLLSVIPRGGGSIIVRFGEEVRVDDLISEHEHRYGPLPKVTTERLQDGLMSCRWESTQQEKLLYSAITKRIECALLKLEEESKATFECPCSPLIRRQT